MRARGLSIALVVFVAGLVFSVGVASAAVRHNLLSSFGSFSAPGSNVESIAVDQLTGDVYVYDVGLQSVYKFNAAGEPAEFSSTHTNVIAGVGAGGPDENQIAVDSSSGATSGNIYVANPGGVKIYGPDGASRGELNGGGPWEGPCGVAVDSAGAVYVGLYSEHVNKYVPAVAASTVTNGDYVSSLSGMQGVCNVGVDSMGSVYAVTWSEGPATKYEALQFNPFGIAAQSSGVSDGGGGTLAVDPSSNDVYVDEGHGVAQYDSAGVLLNTFAAAGAGALGGSAGIAVNQGTGDVYVSDAANHRIEVFGPLVTVPDVVTGGASGLSVSAATLAGSVNPDGLEAECQFEYGTSTAYGSTVPCTLAPGSGGAPVAVAADLSGLEEDTLYHFRLEASDVNGAVQGQDEQFRTLSRPRIDGESVDAIGSDRATLHAVLDPRAADTTYHFEYGTTASYGTSVPLPDADIGSVSADQTVNQRLSGLQPGTAYHYRVVAESANGTRVGPDEVFATFQTIAASGGDSCPNAQARAEQRSAYLPDCRAYEMVSPVDKNGAGIGRYTGRTRAAAHLSAGEAMAVQFSSNGAFAGARGTGIAVDYMGVRDGAPGTQGWTTHAITPLQEPVIFNATVHRAGEPRYEGEFSEDLSTGVFGSWSPVTDAPNVSGVANLYERDDLRTPGAGSYQLLSDCLSPPLGPCASPLKLAPGLFDDPVPYKPFFDWASSDFGHVIFESAQRLTSDATAVPAPSVYENNTPNLYEWDHGTVRLAGILPDGTPAPDSRAGQGQGLDRQRFVRHTISNDGRRIIFTEPESTNTGQWFQGRLFLRVDNGLPDAATVQVNTSERTDCNTQRRESEPSFVCTGAPEPDPFAAPAVYQDASSDGSRVFFTSHEALTDDAPASGGHHEYLYMFDASAPVGHRLTLLANSDTLLVVLGRSDDGKYVYFLDGTQVVPGAPSIAFSAGARGVFLWHDDGTPHGKLTYIGTLTQTGDEGSEEFSEGYPGSPVRVTPDGRHLLFRSASGVGLTGRPSNGNYELYLYGADTGSLVCVSCDPSGAPATSGAVDISDPHESESLMGAATDSSHQNHALSDDGRYVFFTTAGSLVPQDVNGKDDAYEYDALTGEVHLLSSGVGSSNSSFVDASADGRDAFIVTGDQLVGWDSDGLTDIYDVRVDGGFANPPVVVGCTGDACQGQASAAPVVATPSSTTGSGAGNLVAPPSKAAVKARPKRVLVCRRGLVKRRVKGRVRCVAVKRKRAAGRSAGSSVGRSHKRASRRSGR